jgi:aspartate/methionine/tyrosine aminotransferase
VAVTPGRDFGSADTANFIRFSTASAMPQLNVALTRLKDFLK